MNRILAALIFTVLVVGNVQSAFAMDSMHGSMAMPKCAAGDPVVMMNTQTKAYTMADKEHMAMMHMDSGMMDKNTMTQKHMTMMCKSKAAAMGGQMMKGSMKGTM